MPRLARVVNIDVDGVRRQYVPGDTPPQELWPRIDNPKQWAGGKLPEGIEPGTKPESPGTQPEPAPEPEPEAHPLDGLTVKEIRATLDEVGADYGKKDNRAKLVAAYDAHVA